MFRSFFSEDVARELRRPIENRESRNRSTAREAPHAFHHHPLHRVVTVDDPL